MVLHFVIAPEIIFNIILQNNFLENNMKLNLHKTLLKNIVVYFNIHLIFFLYIFYSSCKKRCRAQKKKAKTLHISSFIFGEEIKLQ